MSLDGIQIVRDFAADLKKIKLDEDEMKQVFLNLLNNAAQAIGKNGTVYLTTAYDAASEEIVVSVSDTGSGIPPDILDQIFTPFFTTKEDGLGTGLGLNVSMEIIKKHGGTLVAKNREEGGATFIIRLPTSHEED
jgi:two-component system NtrC family sensor kinase